MAITQRIRAGDSCDHGEFIVCFDTSKGSIKCPVCDMDDNIRDLEQQIKTANEENESLKVFKVLAERLYKGNYCENFGCPANPTQMAKAALKSEGLGKCPGHVRQSVEGKCNE